MRTGDDLAKVLDDLPSKFLVLNISAQVFIAYTHGLRNRLRSGFGLHVSTLANESDLGRFLTPYTMDLIRSQKVVTFLLSLVCPFSFHSPLAGESAASAAQPCRRVDAHAFRALAPVSNA